MPNNPALDPYTIYGKHVNCGGAVGIDSGKDWYLFILLNGWKLDDISYVHDKSSNLELLNAPTKSDLLHKIGKSSWDVQILWGVTPGDRVDYTYRFKIKGPKGTLHHN